MTQRPDINQLSADQLCALATELMDSLDARRSEQLGAVQGKLLAKLIDSDLAAIEAELDQAMTVEQKTARPKQQPKRAPLPPELPRALIHH